MDKKIIIENSFVKEIPIALPNGFLSFIEYCSAINYKSNYYCWVPCDPGMFCTSKTVLKIANSAPFVLPNTVMML